MKEKIDTTKLSPIIKYPTICYVVGIWMILCIIISSLGIVGVHLHLIEVVEKSSIFRIHVYCGLFGMLGAAIAATRKYYKVLITESTNIMNGIEYIPSDWNLGRTYYYLTRPILGFVIGAITYTLSFIGFQVLSEQVTVKISNEGRYLLFALSFISGFSVSHVLSRVEAIAEQIFSPAKQGYDE